MRLIVGEVGERWQSVPHQVRKVESLDELRIALSGENPIGLPEAGHNAVDRELRGGAGFAGGSIPGEHGVMANAGAEGTGGRMLSEGEDRYGSRWEAIRSIAEKLACSA